MNSCKRLNIADRFILTPMTTSTYDQRLSAIRQQHRHVTERDNPIDPTWTHGAFDRLTHPILEAEHVPLHWRFDLNPQTNPHLIERLPINAVFNTGAIEHDGKVCVVLRVEGADRKSFFAVARSDNGITGWVFDDEPVTMPEVDGNPDTNVYDMRLVQHEDGKIYGLFCTERKDKTQPNDLSAAEAQCGLCITEDLKSWQRLPDLKTPSPQQRNVVLHPEFVDGKYLLYTRPQDSFIEAGSGGGIGYAFADTMNPCIVTEENILEPRAYHTIKESKNGLGPAPIKTDKGWLHLAHGVRGSATGLRYVCYLFMTDLDDPTRVTHSPGGFFIAPRAAEQTGDLWSVAFSNGWVCRGDSQVLIYYATNDTQTYVGISDIDRLVDYCINTPEDPLRSAACVQQRVELIRGNAEFLDRIHR
jgi:4-O-beta-D-mannosyl-D-glucose phosphorylase